MHLIEKNLQKIRELQAYCHPPAHQWMNVCMALGLEFEIREAWRTQQRQNQLYAQGRTKKGKIVTWTRNSMHTQRLAMDLYPVPELKGAALLDFYIKIEELAVPYGIVRPLELLKRGDFGHFETATAKMPDPPPSIEAQKKSASDRIRLMKGSVQKRAIQRYREIFKEEPAI